MIVVIIAMFTSCAHQPVNIVDTHRPDEKVILSALCISKMEIDEDNQEATLRIPMNGTTCQDIELQTLKGIPLSLGILENSEYVVTLPLETWDALIDQLILRGVIFEHKELG